MITTNAVKAALVVPFELVKKKRRLF